MVRCMLIAKLEECP